MAATLPGTVYHTHAGNQVKSSRVRSSVEPRHASRLLSKKIETFFEQMMKREPTAQAAPQHSNNPTPSRHPLFPQDPRLLHLLLNL